MTVFLAVLERGSINAAARSLEVGPSQVSKVVGRLERQLGRHLLRRTSRGIAVTPEAEALIPHLQEIVSRFRQAQLGSGPVQQRMTLAGPSYLLPFLVRTAVEALPAMRLRAVQLAPSLIRAHAAEGHFDLALSTEIGRLPKAWTSEEVGRLHHGLFASPELARRLRARPLTVEVLRDVPMISPMSYTAGQFVTVDDGCPLEVHERTVGHEVETIGLALDLAMASPQVVYGPVLAASRYLESGELVELPMAGWREAVPVFLACNHDHVLASVHRAVREALARGLSAIERRRPGAD